MDIVTRNTLDQLFAVSDLPAVSMYLPTRRGAAATHHDELVLKNLIAEAKAVALDNGYDAATVETVLGRFESMATDRSWWDHRELGIAAFATPTFFAAFRVPTTFAAHAVVADRLAVAPLLDAVADERFHVLALAVNDVRLMWGNRFEIGELDLGSAVPKSLADALWFEDPERSLQFHQTGDSGGRLVAHFHGEGGGKDDSDRRLHRFYRLVDGGLSSAIDLDIPLVLAGVDTGVNRFRSVSRHPTIVAASVPGNVERWSNSELHEAAWPLARAWFEDKRRSVASAFLEGSRPVAATTEELVRLAPEGRIDSLFVGRDSTSTPVGTPTATDVIAETELAIAHTWKNGGSVYLVKPDEVPGGGTVAAILRY